MARTGLEGSSQVVDPEAEHPCGPEGPDTGQGELALENLALKARIAELEASAEAQAREQGMLRAMLESAPDATIVSDDSGAIRHVNAGALAMFGYTRDEFLGLRIEELMPERFRARHLRHRARYMREPGARPMGGGSPLYGRTRSGEEFPAEISLSPVHLPGGTMVSTCIRDVTDQATSR